MPVQRIVISLSILATIAILCMGCPYESSFTLHGKPIQYPESLLGNWRSDSVELNFTSVNESELHVYYNDHDEADTTVITGTANMIQFQRKKYIVLKTDNTGTYFIARIIKAGKKELVINILDDKILKKQKSFTSEEAFSNFVYNHEKDCFLPENKVKFIEAGPF